MTRKLFSLILAALVCMAGAAYAGEAVTDAVPVTITFWHSMSDKAGELVDKFVDDFNAGEGKSLGITVEAVFQGQYSDATTKLNSILSAQSLKDLPDVMNLDATGKVAYYASGAAYTLDAALREHPDYDIGRILEIALGNWKYMDEALGMPFAVSTSVMFYNKTLLDAAGMQAPETFEDIIALHHLLPGEAADGSVLHTFAVIPNTPSLANWLGQLGSDTVNNKNGNEAMATELACVDNGALATFLAEWKRMYEEGALTNLQGGSDMFVAGQLALLPTSSSNIASLLEKIGDRFELGVAYYPRVNAEASPGATASGSCVVMFDKGDTARKAAAWAFVKHLASAEVQAEFAAGTGYTPVNEDATEVPLYSELLESHPQYLAPIAQLVLTPPWMRSVTVGPARDFYYAVQDNVSAMLEEGWEVEEAVDIIAEELSGLLTQYSQANK